MKLIYSSRLFKISLFLLLCSCTTTQNEVQNRFENISEKFKHIVLP